MKKLDDNTLEAIKGGDSYVSGPIISAIVSIIKLLQDAGYSVGSGFRRIHEEELCPLK